MRRIFYEFDCFDSSLFTNDKLVHTDTLSKLHTQHFKCVGLYLLSRSVSYFTLEQWIQYALYNDQIPGSRAFEIKKICENDRNLYCFNTLLQLGEKIEIRRQPVCTENYNKQFHLVEYSLYNWFYKNSPALINKLLELKVLYSSFFLKEILHLLVVPFNISSDWFFENFDQFREFALDFKVQWHLLSFEKSDFESDFHKIIAPAFVNWNCILYHDGLFVNRMICSAEIPNGNFVYVPNETIDYEKASDRQLQIYVHNPEPYISNYDYYMLKFLKLSQNGFNSRLTNRVHQYLMGIMDLPSYFSERSQNAIRSFQSQVQVINQMLCYQNKPLFVIGSSLSIGKIKNHCYHKSITSFYTYNYVSHKVEMVNIRPRVRLDNILNVIY